MVTTSLQTLYHKVDYENSLMGDLAKAIRKTQSFFSSWWLCLLYLNHNRVLLNTVNRIERDHGCSCCKFFSSCNVYTKTLKNISECNHEILTIFSNSRSYKIIANLLEYYTEEIDSKIENYEISSDTEIRNLVAELGEKINKKYASQ